MSTKKSILVITGGIEEAEISKISSQFILQNLSKSLYQIFYAELDKNNTLYLLSDNHQEKNNSNIITFEKNGFNFQNKFQYIDYCIPCIHGHPGETGSIQPILEFFDIKYLGNNSEVSNICFNKVTTKMWSELLNIPTTPYIHVYKNASIEAQAKLALNKIGRQSFVKAAKQGSSVGCYPVNDEKELIAAIKKSQQYGHHVLVEKCLKAREIEVSVFEYKNKLQITNPGEVCTNGEFYSFDEKYSPNSHTHTTLEPEKLPTKTINQIKEYCELLFLGIGMKDLCRIDFFLLEDDTIYLNEINTFPGMTSISLFPKLMEKSGVNFADYLNDRINN